MTALVDRLAPHPEKLEHRLRPHAVDPAVTGQLVAATAAVIAAGRATWQSWHVRAEAERQTRAHPATTTLPRAGVDALVEHVVAAVLDPAMSVPLTREDPAEVASGGTPAPLRRADGTSVYQVAGSRLYTSETILAAEQVILDAAARTDGHRIGEAHVDVALLEALANGVPLNDAQAHLVRALATSGARVQVAIAPAGSGKTTALATLTRAWSAAGGTIVGLAPSAAAASVLRENITPTRGDGPHTDTVAKLVWHLTRDTDEPHPDWITRIDARTLILLDEAAMAPTTDLAHLVSYALTRGASVRLVGDDAQLASVAAGGVLRDITATHGAVTLTELVRFTDPAEAAAGLAIRDGDPAGIGFYLDTHRVHVGDLATVTDSAYTAWATDRAAGHDTIMLAPTRELVAQLNTRARNERLATSGEPASRVVSLADGTHASVGDLIITRGNNRRLRLRPTEWVTNGQRWTVRHVHPDGRLAVSDPAGPRRRLTLPADYVAEHVQLGYAATIHGAQGITADTSHTVLTGAESRQQLYVALTRGRHANHLHLAMAGDGAEDAIIRPDTTRPPTAGDLLERILTHDDTAPSATTTTRTMAEPASMLHDASTRYRDALATAAVHVLGPDWAARIDALANQTATAQTGRGLTDQPAWPTLRGHLALHTLTGGADPTELLATAATARETDTARDLAAVLDWRLEPTHRRPAGHDPGPLPWLAAIPPPLAADPQWGAYLTARRDHVVSAAAAVTAAATGWTPANTPGWARPFNSPDCSQVRTRLAVFRAAHAVPDADSRPTGPAQPLAADRISQRALDRQVADTIDTSYRDTWTATAAGLGLRPGIDPHWPALLEHLAELSRAGVDAAALLRRAITENPLPDEYVAAAIRWRITRHTTITTATTTTGPDLLHPAWLPALANAVGPHLAQRLTADPRWPAVVAAITRAAGHGIRYQDLLIHPLGLDGIPVPDDALADALIYRAATLSRPEPADPDTDPDPDEHPPPDDATDTVLDGDLQVPAPDHFGLHTAGTFEPPDPTDDQPNPPDEEEPWPLAAHAQLALAEIIRAGVRPWTPIEAQIAHQLDRAHEADTAPIPPERIHALNEQAAAFYQACYPGSWSAAYLASRLGVDPSADPAIHPGHAPAAWTALTDHLRRHGATTEELLAAGLAKTASNGRLIDTFRDRLILPIHTSTPTGVSVIAGFVARRSPRHDQPENPVAGPKYLNTPRTVAYTKGDQLYAVADHRDRLLDGATPVLVEGPIDALAVTLASTQYVGVAPLGTALSDSQADSLIPYLSRPGGLIIAADPDPAGHTAAERAYWKLSARGGEPRHAHLPAGLDPADLLTHHGRGTLRSILADAGPMGDPLIDTRLGAAEPGGRMYAMHDAVLVAAAGDQHHWAARAHRIAAHLDMPYDDVVGALYDEISTWDGDRATAADRAQAATVNAMRDRHTRLNASFPYQRWGPLARQLHPTLPEHPQWPDLARTLQQAHEEGVNVRALLAAPHGPLDPGNPLRDLNARLHTHRLRHPSSPSIDDPDPVPVFSRAGERPSPRTSRPAQTPAAPPPNCQQ